MTHKDIAQYAVEALRKAGADKASCKVTRGRKDEFNIEANEFSLLRTLFNDELSLKALKDGRKGVTIINKADKDSIDGAVRDCLALAASASPDEAEDIAPAAECKSFDQTAGGADMGKLFERTKEFMETVRDKYPKIELGEMAADFNSAGTVYANSNGVLFSANTEYYGAGVMFTAKDGETSSSFNGWQMKLASLDKAFLDEGMLRTLLEESVRSLDARMVEDKFVGKIVVTPACDDMIWDTLLGGFLGDYAMVTGTSRWKDALGTKVADAKLTMRSAPLHPGMVAGERFTPDGFLSQDVDFIRGGILESFNLSLYGANKTGKPRAGNMASAVEVAAGDASLAEIIKGIDRGILINRFSGGSPGPSGDISGVAKNSFLIENGKVTDALKETMVSFNILDALADIPAISRERCGDGMNLLPWCCFGGVTISGK